MRAEIEFLLAHAGRYLARAPKAADILSAFAGLRPLVKSGVGKTSKLSRSHRIVTAASGLVSIIGGKWTTSRLMGEDTVNHAATAGGLAAKVSTTKTLRLHGWREAGDDRTALAEYGSDAEELCALCEKMGDKPLRPSLPYGAGQVVWAVRREMARTVGDVLSRRLRALMLDARAAVETAPEVARIMALELGRDADWEKRQVEGFGEVAKGYLEG